MQTIEQIINVSVVDAASSTGAGSSALADTGASTLIYLSIALALIAIAIAVTVFTSRKRHGAVRRSSFYSFILAIALGGGIATLAFGQPVAHRRVQLPGKGRGLGVGGNRVGGSKVRGDAARNEVKPRSFHRGISCAYRPLTEFPKAASLEFSQRSDHFFSANERYSSTHCSETRSHV